MQQAQILVRLGVRPLQGQRIPIALIYVSAVILHGNAKQKQGMLLPIQHIQHIAVHLPVTDQSTDQILLGIGLLKGYILKAQTGIGGRPVPAAGLIGMGCRHMISLCLQKTGQTADIAVNVLLVRSGTLRQKRHGLPRQKFKFRVGCGAAEYGGHGIAPNGILMQRIQKGCNRNIRIRLLTQHGKVRKGLVHDHQNMGLLLAGCRLPRIDLLQPGNFPGGITFRNRLIGGAQIQGKIQKKAIEHGSLGIEVHHGNPLHALPGHPRGGHHRRQCRRPDPLFSGRRVSGRQAVHIVNTPGPHQPAPGHTYRYLKAVLGYHIHSGAPGQEILRFQLIAPKFINKAIQSPYQHQNGGCPQNRLTNIPGDHQKQAIDHSHTGHIHHHPVAAGHQEQSLYHPGRNHCRNKNRSHAPRRAQAKTRRRVLRLPVRQEGCRQQQKVSNANLGRIEKAEKPRQPEHQNQCPSFQRNFFSQERHHIKLLGFLRHHRIIGQGDLASVLTQAKAWKMREYFVYFPFFILRDWDKRSAEAHSSHCAALP